MHNITLDNLGFTTVNGLVHDLDEAQNNVERLYIYEVKQKLVIPADAVFFRRFYSNNGIETPISSVPAVCIFNQNDSFFNSATHKTLHSELWSAGKIEIYIILGETRIDIINARKPAVRIGRDVSLVHTDLQLVAEVIQEFEYAKFSAHLFSNGTFWEQSEMQQKIDGNSAPYDFLLDYLMEARTLLLNDKSIKSRLDPGTIDRLLITSILIKFLEGIKDDDEKNTIKSIYERYGLLEDTFEEALRKGVCMGVLADLAGVFNGKIFDTFSDDEKNAISGADLTPIADFLSADIDIKTKQGFLWKQYSFKHLPAEVISAIYENFIQAEADRNAEIRKDVVYTPLHLVNLMIDEAMPLDKPELFENKQFKVLDPACGSGVFLVAAYKRMLQWWAINHWKKTREIAYPDKETAKEILENNIFGVDILEVAVRVSIFGLTTAFLDKLTPKEIWNNLKFKDLSKDNIQGLNFSDWVKKGNNKERRFDLVIGNPPFNESKEGKISNEDLKELFGKKEVPGNKIALKFFEAALYFGKKVCMIIPSNVFLYNKSEPSHKYRKEVFAKYTVEKIYDFTHLRRDLFHKTADTPVVSLLVHNTPSNQQTIEHIIVKRQLLSEKKVLFEIDYYDKHQVRWDWAIDPQKQFVWKTNLLGGGRLFHLVYRLSLLETLEEFILDKKKESSEWLYSSGYKIGGKSAKKTTGSYIYLENTLSTKSSFDEINHRFFTEIEYSEEFESPRPEKLYAPPLLIFSEVLGSRLPMQLFHTKQVFNISFVGIHAPRDKAEILEEIYDRLYRNVLYSKVYQGYLLATSPKLLINKETAFIKEDIDNLPYPKDQKYLEISSEESIIINDVLTYYRHLGKSINKGNNGKVLHDPITQPELIDFGSIFCNTLNDIYAENGKTWQPGKVIETPTSIIYQLGFGQDGGLKYDYRAGAESDIQAIMDNIRPSTGARFKRIIRHYQHVNGFDCVYLIKPKARRYWLQSIALRDADDTFMDLKKAGY